MIGQKTGVAAYAAQASAEASPADSIETVSSVCRVDDLTGRRLDYYLARALGYRFWREKRGIKNPTELAVMQRPGEREPYHKHQRWMEEMGRYREVFDYSDLACGFYGTGFPEFSRDYSVAGLLMDIHMISAEPIFHSTPSGDGLSLAVLKHWHATHPQHRHGRPVATAIGPTRLVAAMRALLKALNGPEVIEQ